MAYSSLHFCSSVGFLAVILLCILLICKKLVFFYVKLFMIIRSPVVLKVYFCLTFCVFLEGLFSC